MKANQIVLITGATAGIGRTTALHLAGLGHQVIATGRNAEALATLRAEAPAGARLDVVSLDVTSAPSIAAAKAEVDRLTDGHGVDVLINNAGYGIAVPVDEIAEDDLRAQFETNVFGLLAVTRAFVPAMRARGAGRILNVSSVGGRMTLPLFGVYNATKYAVESLSNAMRYELRPFGIDVVLIEPGPIRSEFAGRALGLSTRYHRSESPYASVFARAEAIGKRTHAFSPGPIVVAQTMARAIASRRPQARYIVPFSSRLALWLVTLLPTRVVDWAMRQLAGLTPRRLAVGNR